MSKSPLVSVIIPAYNEEKVIRILLSSILRQSYRNIEMIIVDDNSTDNTVKIARQYSQKVYARKHTERSVQRNFGVTKSKGKYLLFLDADMELTKNVVADCVRVTVQDGKVGGVVIPEVSKARTFWEKVKAFERSFYNRDGDEITDAARFFSRQAFEQVGGYDETITGPEDWDLPESIRKRGYKIGHVKSSILHQERIPSILSLLRKKYYYALKSHVYLEKHNISVISAKTVYFLRPVFYKNWRRIISHPLLGIGMFVMFIFETLGGGAGYLVGKYMNK